MKSSTHLAALVLPLCSACASSPPSPLISPTTGATTSTAASPVPSAPAPSFDGCRADLLEPDLKRTPVETPKTEPPPTGSLWISTTYLALTPEPSGQAAFRKSMTELLRVLPTTPGLVAFRFATSEACLSARTLAVWKDEAAMIAFVNGREHHAAMRQISNLSRGSSTFTHWRGTLDAAEWTNAASELSARKGPFL